MSGTVPGFPEPDPQVIADLIAEIDGRKVPWSQTKRWLIRRSVAQLIGVDTRHMTAEEASNALEAAGANLADMVRFHLAVNAQYERLKYGTSGQAVWS